MSVFTSQNYHDYPDKFMGPTDLEVLNKAVFAALKPGGVYIIVDHSAEAGSGLRDTDTVHRIDETTVKQQVVAAGFEYVGESDVLRNQIGRSQEQRVRSRDSRAHGSVRVQVPQAAEVTGASRVDVGAGEAVVRAQGRAAGYTRRHSLDGRGKP